MVSKPANTQARLRPPARRAASERAGRGIGLYMRLGSRTMRLTSTALLQLLSMTAGKRSAPRMPFGSSKPNRATVKVGTMSSSSVCTATSVNLSQQSLAAELRLDGCEQLDFSMAWLGVEGAHALRSALARNTAVLRSLTHVNLTWTAIGAAGAIGLLTVLRQAPRLQSLDLTGNWIGSRNQTIQQLAALVRQAHNLRVLHLRWSNIRGHGAKLIGSEIAAHHGLIEVDLGGNWLYSPGCHEIANACHAHASLQQLRLDNNGIDDDGVVGLAEALRNNSVLLSLDLSSNYIRGEGVRALASVLASNVTALRSLSLSQNQQITDMAAHSMAPALTANSKLEVLDLSGNRISWVGASALAGATRVNTALRWLHLGDNSPSRAYGRATHEINSSILQPLAAMLRRRRQRSPSAPLAADAHALPRLRGSGARRYWHLVYPMGAPTALSKHVSKSLQEISFFFNSAPISLTREPCEQHSWAKCALDVYFKAGQAPPKIPHGAIFAPFRFPVGSCLRNRFSWNFTSSNASVWDTSYPHAAGVPDHSWSEVIHTRDKSGGSWMYLATGSGIFWNCGRSLRARNKAAAAIQLTEEFKPLLASSKRKGNAIETLAHLIASDDPMACDGDHCRGFMKLLNSSRVDRNDNCYGLCSIAKAPLEVWLERAAAGPGAGQWQWDHMSASSVFDQIVWSWAKRLKYDSVQLTMQPQVWCGFSWTTEMVDLRAKLHKVLTLRRHLSVRDPLAPESRGAPCLIRNDSISERVFCLNIFCEGTLMERTARCLADAAKYQLNRFTVYSRFRRSRFDACTQGF